MGKVGGSREKHISEYYHQMAFYEDNGHYSPALDATTEIVSWKKMLRILKEEDNEFACFVNIHDSEKAERFKAQGWEVLQDHPAYELLSRYKDTVFRTELPLEYPERTVQVEHELELVDQVPTHVKQFRLSPDQKEALRKWTKEMERCGIIRPSMSPYCAPTFCVKKPVGWRIVHDYRALNAKTLMPQLPTPLKTPILEAMSGAHYFSCLDLLHGYYQMRMRERDIPYTAFSTPDGLYEYVVAPMGLSGCPGSFHKLVNRVFQDLSEICQTYSDDVFIFTKSKDPKEHLSALERVLDRCAEQKLYVKLSKCIFMADEIPCLGDFVGREGVRMDPDKIRTIKEWPLPKTARQMRQFLGTVAYCQKFCQDYGRLTAPLYKVLKGASKNQLVSLSPDQVEAVETLKAVMTSPPVLVLPDLGKPFGIRTDASDFAIGGVLYQDYGTPDAPHERIVAYAGRKLNDAEINYPVREKELLAVLHAMRIWRPYLLDKPFNVDTDHRSLETLLTQKHCTRRLARWLDELAEYRPRFRWIPGTSNNLADGLSRRVDFEAEDCRLELRDILEAVLKETRVEEVSSYYIYQEEIPALCRKAYPNDTKFKTPWAVLREGQGDTYMHRHYKISNDVLWFKTGEDDHWRLCIPSVQDLKDRILREAHDQMTAGHPGSFRTLKKLQENYFWPRMDRDVRRYVSTCELCQRNKARQTKPPGQLHPLPIPSHPWTKISMDFITKLPKTRRNHDALMIIVDRLTKRAIFIPTKGSANAEETAQLFLDYYQRNHGLPESIISDRDSKFTSDLWTQIMKLQKVELELSSAFRPNTDGQTERTNRFFNDYGRAFTSPYHNDWDQFCGLAEYAYNARYHAAIGMSPFEADIGYIPPTPVDLAIGELQSEASKPHAHRVLEYRLMRYQQLQDNMQCAQERMKTCYDRNRPQQLFKVGDQVLLSTEHLALHHAGVPSGGVTRFTPRYIGPYVVEAVHTPDTYKLCLPPGLKLHPFFHTSLLKAYKRDHRAGNTPKPSVTLDGGMGYIVEKIVASRKRQGQMEFKVRWLGYSPSDDTWEPEAHLKQARGHILDFLHTKGAHRSTAAASS